MEALGHIDEASLPCGVGYLLLFGRHLSHALHVFLVEDEEATPVALLPLVQCLGLQLLSFALLHLRRTHDFVPLLVGASNVEQVGKEGVVVLSISHSDVILAV